VSRFLPVAVLPLLLASVALHAQTPKPPPVRVNILNVCTPAEADRAVMAAALEQIPMKPEFSAEFEVARGRTIMQDSAPADWVRMRREFNPRSALVNAQYSFSVDPGAITETLVVRTRDPRDIVQVSLEDNVTAAQPSAVLATHTPPNRIKVERFGKGVLVLARCPQADQSAYEPLLRRASSLMTAYRNALDTRKVISAELTILGRENGAKPKP